jgi:hypothetical protein
LAKDEYLITGKASKKDNPPPKSRSKSPAKSPTEINGADGDDESSEEPNAQTRIVAKKITKTKSPKKMQNRTRAKTDLTDELVVNLDFERFIGSSTPTKNKTSAKRDNNTSASTAPLSVPAPTPVKEEEKKLLTGIRFHIHSDLGMVERTTVLGLLKEHGGIEEKVIDNAQYIIWPRVVYSVRDVGSLMLDGQHVTVLWLTDSATKKSLQPISDHFFYTPIFAQKVDLSKHGVSIKNGVKPLITFTGYHNNQKNDITSLIGAMGAEYNHKLSRRVDYLITESDNSEKYRFAVKNNIPIMKLQWLYDSARQGHLKNPQGYYYRAPDEDVTVPVSATTSVPSSSSSGFASDTVFDTKDAMNWLQQEDTRKPNSPPSITVIAPSPPTKMDAKAVLKKTSPPPRPQPKAVPAPTKAPEPSNVPSEFDAIVRNLIATSVPTTESEIKSTDLLAEVKDDAPVRMTRKDLESGSFYATQRQQENHGFDLLSGTNVSELASDRQFNERILNSRKEVNNQSTGNSMSGVAFTMNLESQQDVRWDLNRDKNELKQVLANGSFSDEPKLAKPKKYCFTLSGLEKETMAGLTKKVEHLGGTVINEFKLGATTHVIAAKPGKTEKLLCGIAANLWIIHPDFIIDSFKHKQWQDEEGYVWTPQFAAEKGHNRNTPLLNGIAYITKTIISCREGSSKPRGLFYGWRVLLDVEEDKLPGFINLIEAGDAEYLDKPVKDWKNCNGLTHIMVSKKALSAEISGQLKEAAKAGIHVWMSDDLSKYMNSPDIDTNSLSIFKTSSSSGVLGKRKDLSSNDSESSSGNTPTVRPVRKRTKKQ